MSPELILYPAYPMFLVFIATFARLAQLRFGAVSSGKVDPAYYRLFAGGEEPPEIRVVSRHFQNQFEVPPLFYTAVLIAYVTHSVNVWTVLLAWAYVALRIVHTVVHLGSNDVLTRFRLVRREQPRPHGPLDERVRHDRLRLKPPPRPLEGRGGWRCGWPVRYWHGRAQRLS